MNTLDILTALAIFSIAIILIGIGVAYLFVWWKKPKNYLIILNGRNYKPIRIKKPGATSQVWVNPSDKKPITFKLHPSFSMQDDKGGLRYFGDPKTGLLVRFNSEAADFEYMDPRYPMQALQDGRPLQIIRSLKAEPAWMQYVPLGLLVVGVLVAITLFMVYKMYSAAHTGG